MIQIIFKYKKKKLTENKNISPEKVKHIHVVATKISAWL